MNPAPLIAILVALGLAGAGGAYWYYAADRVIEEGKMASGWEWRVYRDDGRYYPEVRQVIPGFADPKWKRLSIPGFDDPKDAKGVAVAHIAGKLTPPNGPGVGAGTGEPAIASVSVAAAQPDFVLVAREIN